MLSVETIDGFKVGQKIIIDEGTDAEEVNGVSGFGSLMLELPLKFGHQRDARVKAIQPGDNAALRVDHSASLDLPRDRRSAIRSTPPACTLMVTIIGANSLS